LNQLITKAGSIGAEHYSYDKRGNLSAITLDDAIKNTYVYGAINRLEQATNVKGEIAKYLYNGLGNRVGKQIGTVPTGTLRPAELDTPSPVDFHSERRIDYIVDLTMEYNNLLVKKNGDISNEYTFDAGLLFKNDELFINDELTSPVGRIGKNGVIIAQTSFDEFGVELAGNVDDDFTYIGYQQDAISGTYFAQKREYMPSAARFAGTDIFAGFAVHPLSLNKYTYCFNSPLILADFDGAWPEAIADIGNGFKAAGKWVSDHKSDIIKVVGTVAVVGAATAFTVATFGAGTAISAIAVSAAVGAGVGGTVNGVMNLKNGGSFGNGFIGGAISGAIQGGLGTALGPVGTILGGAGNGIGIATTETLDRIDGNNTKSTTEIIKDGFIGAGLGVVCSLPGGLIQAGVDGSWARNILSGEGYNSYKEIIKANTKFLKDLMPNYTRFFGERLVDVSGIFDNMLLNDMMNGCDND
jgi:RHS repeat-associated protein